MNFLFISISMILLIVFLVRIFMDIYNSIFTDFIKFY